MGRAKRGGRPAVEIEGAPQLRRALRNMDDRVEDMSGLHGSLAELVADTGRELVPVLEGLLESTIKPGRTKTGAYVTAGGRSAIYGPAVHFGWRAHNIEPQPFLYEALDERRQEVIARYESHVDELVARFDREAPK